MTHGSHTEPEHFKDIFERGIDPDVDDPSKIHVRPLGHAVLTLVSFGGSGC